MIVYFVYLVHSNINNLNVSDGVASHAHIMYTVTAAGQVGPLCTNTITIERPSFVATERAVYQRPSTKRKQQCGWRSTTSFVRLLHVNQLSKCCVSRVVELVVCRKSDCLSFRYNYYAYIYIYTNLGLNGKFGLAS